MNIENKYGIVSIILNIMIDQGFELSPDKRVMDFGCGSGANVKTLRKLGYHAYGCDIKFKKEVSVNTENMISEEIIKKIKLKPYVLPYEDNSFDFIYSNQVFEHVQNYSETISELKRILKPDGVSLHILPSRYNPIEPHVFVPLSTIVRNYHWLYLWALIGIRKKEQKGLSPHDVAKENKEFLEKNTNYLSKEKLTKEFLNYFSNVNFCESSFLKYAPRGKYMYSASRGMPIITSIYSTFRTRVLLVSNN
jgi:SAM-dependent methyltransferase